MGKKGIKKSLKIYLSKLKNPAARLSTPANSSSGAPSAASRLLSSVCKYPKTTSLRWQGGDNRSSGDGDDTEDRDRAATLSDVDRFLAENFRSLYVGGGGGGGGHCSDSDDEDETPRDSFVSSSRFFVFPEASSSIKEHAGRRRLTAPAPAPEEEEEEAGAPVVPGGGVAVTTFSRDPYDDFRRSMGEMMEASIAGAGGGAGKTLDWDFMEELLLCFLELNDRAVHKFVLRAFADLTVYFRSRLPAAVLPEPDDDRRRRRTNSKAAGAPLPLPLPPPGRSPLSLAPGL